MSVPVTFVIPTFRRPGPLGATLDAVLAVEHDGPCRVVVVDDGADAETRRVVAARARGRWPVEYVAGTGSGAANARNLGAARADEGFIVFLDDDMLVEPDHVRAHLAAHAQTDGRLVNGHWEFPAPMRRELERTPFGRFRLEVEDWVKDGVAKTPIDGRRRHVAMVTACNLSVTVEDFRALGGFDESFPFAGYEDQDLSLHARDAGFPMVYDDAIALRHNDRRLDLRGFCERQRRGAHTAVVLAAKHPDEARGRAMIVENAPGAGGAKSAVKAALGTRLGLRALHGAIALLERTAPRGRALRRAYWAATGVYIFLGVRDGFRALGPERRHALEEALGRG